MVYWTEALKSQLRKLGEDHDTYTISMMMDLKYNAVKCACRRYGIKTKRKKYTRNKLNEDNKKEIRELAKTMTTSELSKHLKIADQNLSLHLRKEKIATKTNKVRKKLTTEEERKKNIEWLILRHKENPISNKVLWPPGSLAHTVKY